MSPIFSGKGAILILALFLTACVAIPTQTVTLVYSDIFSSYEGAGKGSLTGQAFLRQQGGGVVVCAGEDVFLHPYAGPFQEAYDLAKSGTRPIVAGSENERFSVVAANDPRFASLVKRTRCDAQGNFEFSNLRTGKWIVSTIVRWVVADIWQGSSLSTVVEIDANQRTKVLLTGSDRL